MSEREGERIARLEERADTNDASHENFSGKLDQIASDVHTIKEQLSNWRGFFSGVVFAISALAGLIGAGAMALYHRVFGA
jgi:hypothetical protein